MVRGGGTRALRYLLLALLALFAALLVLARTGSAAVPPAALAAVAGVAAAVALARLAPLVAGIAAGRARTWRAGGELLLLAGLVATAGGGLANWALGVQGYVVLQEGEAIPLLGGAHLQSFVAGPLAIPADTRLAVRLDQVKLRPGPDGAAEAESRLTIDRPGAAPVAHVLSARTPVEVGSLRLVQGAFGFAPRVVVVRDGKTLFDGHVSFFSRQEGGATPSFDGTVELPPEKLVVSARVVLDGLDERLRGHPRLAMEVACDGAVIAAGELQPGHFAELSGGLRVGFAGMKMWSEIDLRRRAYPGVVVAGLAALLLGALLWPVAAWRRW